MNMVNSLNVIKGILLLCMLEIYEAKIDCYTCLSRNGSDTRCQDPFHPAYLPLNVDCRQTRDGRVGEFPARYCTKIKGVSTTDGTETIIRSCAIESLDNMCGQFEIENVRYTGCVNSCDIDACNISIHAKPEVMYTVIMTIFTAVIKTFLLR